MSNQICELSTNELDAVSGGDITVIAEKGYIGIEIRVGGYGIAVWATEGSVCGSVRYPGHNGGTCVPT
jgi:bacteriocin-like protein